VPLKKNVFPVPPPWKRPRVWETPLKIRAPWRVPMGGNLSQGFNANTPPPKPVSKASRSDPELPRGRKQLKTSGEESREETKGT